MSTINRTIATSILVFLIVAASLALAGEAYASSQRAMWVWGMSNAIVMDTTYPAAGAKKDFFDYCAAPHGDATKKITYIFFDAQPYGVDLMNATNAAKLRTFLSQAHTNGISVDFLSGDQAWATPEYRSVGETLVDEVTTFNAAGTAAQRFDGIQYDVEPYLLSSEKAGNTLDWNYDLATIWNTYLTLLIDCQTKINTYNTSHASALMRFGVTIPYWYNVNSGPVPRADDVMKIVDYVALMSYRDAGASIINSAQDEIVAAVTAPCQVYIGVETSHPTDNVDFPPSTTFYEEGNTAMETALAQVESAFSGYLSYDGIAIHYYEDSLVYAHGKEFSYRSLTAGAASSHFPIVSVVSPNRNGETWYKSATAGATAGYIQWDASDLDGGALTIKLEYSANGGTSWNTIVASTSNTGSYPWDTSALTAGTNYLIKVSVTDPSGNTWYDYSNYPFEISSTVTAASITDLYAWNESATSIKLVWTPPPIYTPKSYRILRGINGATPTEIAGSPVVAVSKYTDTGLSSTNKYRYQVKPIYGNATEGALSNTSEMLMPGDTFLIDCFEQTEGVTPDGPWGPQAAYLTPSFDTTTVHEGTKSRKFVYTYNTGVGGWGAVLNGILPMKVDLSAYTGIEFWAAGGTVGKTAIKISLAETGRPEGNETWEGELTAPTISNTGWTLYHFDFSNFILSDGTGNGRLDLHSIGTYGLIFSSTTASGTYYVDDIKAVKSPSTITLPGSGYTFGTKSGTAADHRFHIGPIPITYGGFSPPWAIRIWTNNGIGAAQSGLKGADNVTYMPLRVWCGNFGPAGYSTTPPDEENDAYWVNNDLTGGWYRIPEDDEMTSDRYTWRRLAWIGPTRYSTDPYQDASLGNPFDIYLAIDIQGKKNQVYSTSMLTIEYINQ